ncbi:MAG: glutathionylspermidine synthase family protein [Anaerolineae bacterium]
MSVPLRAAAPLTAAQYREMKMQVIFDHLKWDPQVGDVSILADFPLLIGAQEWQQLAAWAEGLAAETLAAEAELCQRPELHKKLGLPRAVGKLWQRPMPVNGQGHVRLMRFDFHYAANGWVISEVNSDVPGGFNEATGYTRLMSGFYPNTTPTGDPTTAIAQAVRAGLPPDALVALVHATAYTDDRQVMQYLGKHLEREGLRTMLVSPSHLRWQNGRTSLAADWAQGAVDFIVRFFPAEWLPNMPKVLGWQNYFVGSRMPCCNPTTALLTQSKRFPLVWDELRTSLPLWRRLLPETRDPRVMPDKPTAGWVVKPAFGRVGESVAIEGVASTKDMEKTWKEARRHPDDWLMQRRFDIQPVENNGKRWYPCVGVYTVNGRAAGVYGRMGQLPVINATAPDVAVLIGDV